MPRDYRRLNSNDLIDFSNSGVAAEIAAESERLARQQAEMAVQRTSTQWNLMPSWGTITDPYPVNGTVTTGGIGGPITYEPPQEKVSYKDLQNQKLLTKAKETRDAIMLIFGEGAMAHSKNGVKLLDVYNNLDKTIKEMEK